MRRMKRTTRRRPTRKGRVMKRTVGWKKYKQRARRSYQMNVDGFVRRKFKFHYGTWALGTAAIGDYYRHLGGFSLGLAPSQFQNLLNMFDQFKVNRITVHYRPAIDLINFPGNSTVAPTFGKEYLAVNYDQFSSGPSSVISAWNSANLNVFMGDSPNRTFIKQMRSPGVRISWRPSIFEQVTDAAFGASTPQIKSKKLGWVYTRDIALGLGTAQYTGPQVFRYTAGFDPSPTTTWDVYYELDVSFKNVRNALS